MILKQRSLITFDKNNKDHVQSFKKFLVQSHWQGGCPFDLEYPWNSVPDMIKDKLIRHYLKIEE